MPYINKDARVELQKPLAEIGYAIGDAANGGPVEGILNYVITSIVCDKDLWTKTNEEYELKYRHYNAIIGVLECAKQEIYRRMTGPYEDLAIAKNGDIDVFENGV